VATSSPNTRNLVNNEHRGWKLEARLLHSLSADRAGWVCYATRPASTQELNLGRWLSSDLALEHGRAYVDRRVQEPVPTRPRLTVKRRQ